MDVTNTAKSNLAMVALARLQSAPLSVETNSSNHQRPAMMEDRSMVMAATATARWKTAGLAKPTRMATLNAQQSVEMVKSEEMRHAMTRTLFSWTDATLHVRSKMAGHAPLREVLAPHLAVTSASGARRAAMMVIMRMETGAAVHAK